jgi:hypothetical protein
VEKGAESMNAFSVWHHCQPSGLTNGADLMNDETIKQHHEELQARAETVSAERYFVD